eukprot:1602251-Amphidinium_carterae.1
MATLVYENPKQAKDYLAKFRLEERKIKGAKIFLAREKTMEQQRVGYIVRESRRQMVALGVGRDIELEERSCSLFVHRHAVVVVREGKVGRCLVYIGEPWNNIAPIRAWKARGPQPSSIAHFATHNT